MLFTFVFKATTNSKINFFLKRLGKQFNMGVTVLCITLSFLSEDDQRVKFVLSEVLFY